MSFGAFQSLFKDSVVTPNVADPGQLADVNDKLVQKNLPRNIKWYPIYSDRPNTYQGDLMFEPYVNSKGEKILQAILCLINVNTKYAFARTVDYKKNVRKEEERNWNDTSTRVFLNNKDASLVLRSFKRMLQDMHDEDRVLDEFPVLKNHPRFKVERLYVDDGSEFKGVFTQFCREEGIKLVQYNPQLTPKRHLGIIERFNRTMRRLMEKQLSMKGKRTLDQVIPDCLDLYNRYLNHRVIEAFFRRDMQKHQRMEERHIRFFPAMMLQPGLEEKYVNYMQGKTHQLDEFYSKKITQLQPGTTIRYYKRNKDPFTKSRGSTMSEPVKVLGKHHYSHVNRQGEKVEAQGSSYTLENTLQRYMPYEMEVHRPLKRNKNSGY